MSRGLAVGIDVGGTKIAAGVVDQHGHVLASRRTATPSDSSDELVEAVVGLVESLRTDHAVEAVGLSVAAFVDRDRARVVTAPNLAWRDVPLRDLVSSRTGLPAVVENDGNAAAWGERTFGAGRGVDDLLLVAVGTGVGGGIVLGGELRRGGHGMAAEIGHVTLVTDGRPCGCGRRGCLEQYASGSALVAAAPPDTDGPMLAEQAQSGDAGAVRLFEELGTHLGVGLASLVAVLDPEVIVLGGGVAEVGDLLLTPVRTALLAELPGGPERPAPRLVPALLGNTAGLVGAAHLALMERA